jgi:hypothetical protein
MAEYQLFRGDSLELFLNVTIPGPGHTRPPVDITGCTLWMTCKRKREDLDADAIFQVSTSGGQIVITDGPNGKATIVVPAAATVNLVQEERFFYDIQLRSASGVVRTIESGIIVLQLDVTRAIS